MAKTFEELLAMSDQALQAYAYTLNPKSFVCEAPGIFDGLQRLYAFFEELKERDLDDLCTVDEILRVRQDIARLEALKRSHS